jgi:RHS repeat-associated protein
VVGLPAVATGSVAYNQTFGYDQYGNMTCTASPSNPKCLAPTYSATTNRIASYQYDNAGDVTNDGTFGYQWDAEGKLTTITLSGNTIATNLYNALGQNMRHQVPGQTIDEFYGADGFLLGRSVATWADARTRVFIPFQGRVLVEYYGGSTPGTLFPHPDELGSLSTAIDYATSHSAERLFFPFGELWTGSDLYSLNPHQTFAQLPDYDNDSSSDLYNTPNRHYTPMGRWLSPDPLACDITNPQSLNRYAYVLNNPMTLIDPLGLQEKSNIKLQAEPTASGCTLNGIYTSCSVVASVVNAGAAVACTSVNCGGVRPTQGPAGSTVWQQWVPPQLVVIEGGLPNGGIALAEFYFEGGWESLAGLSDPGIVFTQTSPTTWTFVSEYPIGRTVAQFYHAGFTVTPPDLINWNHPGQLDMRDTSLFCSAHVDINKRSGDNSSTPTTGQVHLDTVNPWGSPGAFAVFGFLPALSHLVLDQWGLYPGKDACR